MEHGERREVFSVEDAEVVLFADLILVFALAAWMTHNKLILVIDQHTVIVGLNLHGLTYEPSGYRVAVRLKGDQAVTGHIPYGPLLDVIPRLAFV